MRLIFVTTLLLSQPAIAATCDKDSDCESNYQCVENTCRLSGSSTSETDINRTKGGLEFSHKEEKLTRVTNPVDSVHLGTWSLIGMIMIPSTGDASGGGGGGIGYRYLDPSGSFPSVDGGTANCLDFRLDVSGMGMSSGSGNININGALAYTWLSFDKQSPSEVTQSGWGVNLGIGGNVSIPLGAENSDINISPQPIVGLEFVDWNPGTAKYDSFYIMGMILPIGGFSANIALGGTL